MGNRNNAHENGLTPEDEPIPLILPTANEIAQQYGKNAARLFDAEERYEGKRAVVHHARNGTLESIDDTKDRPVPLPNDGDFSIDQPDGASERATLLKAIARRSSDAVIPELTEHVERYKNEISNAEEQLHDATTTPSDEEAIRKKIAVRALEIHMLVTLLNGGALTWARTKNLADADDRCDVLSTAAMEKLFLAYMKTCIERKLIIPASA